MAFADFSISSIQNGKGKVLTVAEVGRCSKHPNADKLKVPTVHAGSGELLTIVCGASNVSVGMKVPCALVGAQLPGLQIKSAKLRGIESAGLLCSAKELGLADVADSLLALPDDAPIGEDFRNYYLLNDRVFTLSLTPNRADCLSVVGVAREVAAITATELIAPTPIPEVSIKIPDTLEVNIAASEVCPLYCGRVIKGINLKTKIPLWMAHRL